MLVTRSIASVQELTGKHLNLKLLYSYADLH